MKENQHIEEKDWELLAKSIYDQNTDSTADVSAAETIFSDEKEREQLLKTTRQVDLYFELNQYQANPAWEKVASRIYHSSANKQPRLRTLLISPLFRIASAIIFAALLMVAGYEVFYSPESTGKMLEVSSTNQILNTFALPDGTMVSLNTNTKITYPEKFGRKIREVSIEGEAFFEVKPNKHKPFIIHAGKAQIKVLGTSFNVSAYPTTKQVEVIVETGKVQVLNKNTETVKTNELILTPGDKGTLVYSNNSLLKTTNQNPNFLAWKTRNLIFKATSLLEVIGNLEKVYNVNIRLANPRLNELLLTAQFNDYSLDFILKVIENTFQLEAKKVNGQYILKARS